MARRHMMAVLGVAALTVLTACGGPSGGSGEGLTPVKLGMAVEKDAANMAFVVADREGIYEDCGLDAEVTFFEGGGALVPPLTVGEVDYGWVGTTTILSAIEEDAPIKTIAEVNQTVAGWGLVVPEDSPIKTLEDLQPGVKISFTSEGALSQWFALWAIDQAGVSPDDMTGVPLGGSVPAIRTALEKGDIDAAVVLLPWGQMLEQDGMRWVAKFDEELPELTFTGLHASERALQDEETASKVLGAYVKAVQWLKDHPEEAKTFIAEFYGVEADLAAEIYTLVVPDYNPTGEFATEDMEYLIETVGEIPGFIEGTAEAEEVLHNIEPADC